MKMEVKKINSLKSKVDIVWFLALMFRTIVGFCMHILDSTAASTTTKRESNGKIMKFRKELGTTKDDLQFGMEEFKFQFHYKKRANIKVKVEAQVAGEEC
ncbi:hypothetical protein MKW92_028970 [Papaver armeniacum]|nr:hypothetical protein MKW92_028970 [Papaver armeniacum]